MPNLRCLSALVDVPAPKVPLAVCRNCGGSWASGAAPEKLREQVDAGEAAAAATAQSGARATSTHATR